VTSTVQGAEAGPPIPGTDPWRVVPRAEFTDRQQRVRAAAAEQGFDAAVVWSRGGAFMDMSADVLYLTNHYSQQPYMGDEAGIGSARSHGVCILPVDGPSTVVVDIPWWRKDLVVADQVRPSIHVVETAAQAIRDAGLERGRLAVVGASYMTAAAYLGLAEQLPNATLVRADQLVEQIRVIKSPAEQVLIRHSCEIGNRAVEALMETAVVGATEAEAHAAAASTVISAGAALYDAPCSSGPWANGFAYGRLPSADASRPLQAGDMFHCDCYGSYGGYFFDFGRSRCIGDNPTPRQRGLLEAVIEAVDTICAEVRPGVTGDDLYRVGERWMAGSPVVQGLAEEEPEMEGFPAVGHGLGMMWERPWLMPGDRTVIEPGMYLAVELLLGDPEIGGAMFEQNGLVTDTGFEVLTTARARWW
jgi:Xaa-Pro aminopeptidase